MIVRWTTAGTHGSTIRIRGTAVGACLKAALAHPIAPLESAEKLSESAENPLESTEAPSDSAEKLSDSAEKLSESAKVLSGSAEESLEFTREPSGSTE